MIRETAHFIRATIPVAAGPDAAESFVGSKLQPDATVITSCSSGSHRSGGLLAYWSFFSASVTAPVWHTISPLSPM